MGCATMAGHVCWHKENTPTMGEWQFAREGRYIHYTTHAIMLVEGCLINAYLWL